MKKITKIIQASYMDEEYRKIIIFNLLNILLAVVSFVMTIVNLCTKEFELMYVTGAFTLLCLANYLLISIKKFKRDIAFSVFSVEAMVLLVYFVLSGNPEGFSVLWTLLVPSLAMAIFGQKMGIKFSIAVLIMVIFFFWIPFGRSLLYYDYNETFMLRFPFVYVCLFLASLYLEAIRMGAYHKLQETEEHTRYLYRHDALTGLYSRYAFYEELKTLFASPSDKKVAVSVFDLDNFKVINDIYGHNAGDEVLKTMANIVLENICEHSIACRWGGEEFMVLMQCDHDPLEITENIRRVMESAVVVYEGKEIRTTTSAGLAIADSLSGTADLGSLINQADKAMYASKLSGKNKTTKVQFIKKERR